jgi:hypothetical protein
MQSPVEWKSPPYSGEDSFVRSDQEVDEQSSMLLPERKKEIWFKG